MGISSRKGPRWHRAPWPRGHNAKYFENPLEFHPERWARENEKQLPKGAYIPFAAGPRVCLGKQFAMMEMQIILGTLIQNVDINVLPDFEPDFVAALALNPGEKGMQMTVKFRDGAPVLRSSNRDHRVFTRPDLAPRRRSPSQAPGCLHTRHLLPLTPDHAAN